MKLPNCDKAFVPRDKLTKYLLSESHPVGSSKAKFFGGLGFNRSNVDKLRRAFLAIAQENDVKRERKFEYGTSFVIDGVIEAPTGKKVEITTVWFLKTARSRPV